MESEMIVLRILHIVLGVFWGGMAFFFSSFLGPSMKDSWPASASVVQRLFERRFMVWIPIIGGITILTGFRMYMIDSHGFDPTWIRTGAGLCYTIGGVAGLIGLIIGFAGIKPRAIKLGALLAAAQGPERDARLVGAKDAFVQMGQAIAWAGRFIGIAVILMAIARYV